MSDDPKEPFANTMQSAIYNFCMSMIVQYRKTMDPVAAATKTADWLQALADKIREQSSLIHQENKEKMENNKDAKSE